MSVPPVQNVDLWKQLITPDARPLLNAVEAADVRRPGDLAQLRRQWPADLIAIAIELARARRKAAAKFPDPSRIVADVTGVEQATSHRVAAHKAQRFAHLGIGRVHDLCCGIGGDAMSLAPIAQVIAIDTSPLRAWMTEQNARCETRVGDVEHLRIVDEFFHLDPDRRVEEAGGGARRVRRFEDYEPGPDTIWKLLVRCPDGAIKMGPGVDFDSLPMNGDREIEVINESGTLVQAVLWCGRLAFQRGQRTATRVPDGLSFSAVPEGEAPSKGSLDRYLMIPDPAIERAGLSGRLAREVKAAAIHPGLGLLTAPDISESPWLRQFEVLEQMPWRMKRIKGWLKDHDAGMVIVKTRGQAVDPDIVQRELRGKGESVFTVFALRLGEQRIAVLTREEGLENSRARELEKEVGCSRAERRRRPSGEEEAVPPAPG